MWEPRLLAGVHSPNGQSHVVLRLDGLTLRIYDRAALDTYAKAWVAGYRCAGLAFGEGDLPSLESLLRRAHDQSRTPYRLDPLAGADRQNAADRHVEQSSELRHL